MSDELDRFEDEVRTSLLTLGDRAPAPAPAPPTLNRPLRGAARWTSTWTWRNPIAVAGFAVAVVVAIVAAVAIVRRDDHTTIAPAPSVAGTPAESPMAIYELLPTGYLRFGLPSSDSTLHGQFSTHVLATRWGELTLTAEPTLDDAVPDPNWRLAPAFSVHRERRDDQVVVTWVYDRPSAFRLTMSAPASAPDDLLALVILSILSTPSLSEPVAAPLPQTMPSVVGKTVGRAVLPLETVPVKVELVRTGAAGVVLTQDPVAGQAMRATTLTVGLGDTDGFRLVSDASGRLVGLVPESFDHLSNGLAPTAGLPVVLPDGTLVGFERGRRFLSIPDATKIALADAQTSPDTTAVAPPSLPPVLSPMTRASSSATSIEIGGLRIDPASNGWAVATQIECAGADVQLRLVPAADAALPCSNDRTYFDIVTPSAEFVASTLSACTSGIVEELPGCQALETAPGGVAVGSMLVVSASMALDWRVRGERWPTMSLVTPGVSREESPLPSPYEPVEKAARLQASGACAALVQLAPNATIPCTDHGGVDAVIEVAGLIGPYGATAWVRLTATAGDRTIEQLWKLRLGWDTATYRFFWTVAGFEGDIPR